MVEEIAPPPRRAYRDMTVVGHQVSTRRLGRGASVAACSCGWSSPMRVLSRRTRRDARRHLETAWPMLLAQAAGETAGRWVLRLDGARLAAAQQAYTLAASTTAERDTVAAAWQRVLVLSHNLAVAQEAMARELESARLVRSAQG